MCHLSDPSTSSPQHQATPAPSFSLWICLPSLSFFSSLGSECHPPLLHYCRNLDLCTSWLACGSLSHSGTWGCVPRGRKDGKTCQAGLVVHNISGLAPDYLFQTQFVALPGAATSLKHVTQLPPSLPGPQSGEFSMGSLPGPDSCQLGDGAPARSIDPGSQL